jgi:preprotein translocase subunit SecD
MTERRPRPRLRAARGLLLLAFVLLLAVGCGSSGRNCPEVVLRAVPDKGQQVTPTGMRIARQIVEQRVDGLGVTSPTVTVHGGEIVIGLPGVHHPARIASIAFTPGRLQIFDFEPSLAPPTVTGNQRPEPLPSLYRLLEAVQSRADRGSPQAYYLFEKNGHRVVRGPAPDLEQLLSPYKGRPPAQTVVLKVPANTEPVSCATASGGCPGAGSNGASTSGQYWYLFRLPAALTGTDLVNSGITADVDPSTGRPIVTLEFTKHGSHEFQAITKAEYDRGRVDAGEAGQLGSRNRSTINRYAAHNAIVLDGRLEETPYIDYTDAILSDGIVGNAQITEPSTQAAKRAALVLQSGSLPYSFEQVKTVGCAR